MRSELQTNPVFLGLDTAKQEELLKKGKIAGKWPPFQPWIKIANCELFPQAGEALKEMPDAAARLAEIYARASQML